jgi:hypothetical protein
MALSNCAMIWEHISMQSFKELCIQAMILMAGHENNMSLLERGFCQMKFIRKSGKILAFVKKQFTIERIQPRTGLFVQLL